MNPMSQDSPAFWRVPTAALFPQLGARRMAQASDLRIVKKQEAGMVFLSFLVLYDPPKPGIVGTISHLAHLGVSLKMITGDNRLVAAHAAREVGLPCARILTGSELRHLSDKALLQRVNAVCVFAEV